MGCTAFCAQADEQEILMIDKLISVNQRNPINDLLFRVFSLRHNKNFIHLLTGLVLGWSRTGGGTGGVVVRYSRSPILIFCVSLPFLLLWMVLVFGCRGVTFEFVSHHRDIPEFYSSSINLMKRNPVSHPPKDKLLNETEFRSFTFRIPRLHFIALACGGWL